MVLAINFFRNLFLVSNTGIASRSSQALDAEKMRAHQHHPLKGPRRTRVRRGGRRHPVRRADKVKGQSNGSVLEEDVRFRSAASFTSRSRVTRRHPCFQLASFGQRCGHVGVCKPLSMCMESRGAKNTERASVQALHRDPAAPELDHWSLLIPSTQYLMEDSSPAGVPSGWVGGGTMP